MCPPSATTVSARCLFIYIFRHKFTRKIIKIMISLQWHVSHFMPSRRSRRLHQMMRINLLRQSERMQTHIKTFVCCFFLVFTAFRYGAHLRKKKYWILRRISSRSSPKFIHEWSEAIAVNWSQRQASSSIDMTLSHTKTTHTHGDSQSNHNGLFFVMSCSVDFNGCACVRARRCHVCAHQRLD